MKTIFKLLLMFISLSTLNAQQPSFGGGVLYNIQNNGLGIDLRANYPLSIHHIDFLNNFAVVPQLAYTPIGLRHDLNLGFSLHAGIFKPKKMLFYGLSNFSYSMWLNHKGSNDENARLSNMGVDIGLGWTMDKCLRPFFETRYDVLHNELKIHAGVMFIFNCQKFGALPCPKPVKPPKF